MSQMSFSDFEYAGKRKQTRRERLDGVNFLSQCFVSIGQRRGLGLEGGGIAVDLGVQLADL